MLEEVRCVGPNSHSYSLDGESIKRGPLCWFCYSHSSKKERAAKGAQALHPPSHSYL